jgi:hypothetical protein
VFYKYLLTPKGLLNNYMAADNLFLQAKAFSSNFAFWRSSSAISRLRP